jgi:hypothetical protein
MGWVSSLEDTLADTLGGHPWRTPLEDTLGGHPWRTPWRPPLEDTWRAPWRTPLEDPFGGHFWRTPWKTRVSSKRVLQGRPPRCHPGVLQKFPPGVSSNVSSNVSSKVSSRGVLQGCPPRCASGVSSKEDTHPILFIYRKLDSLEVDFHFTLPNHICNK